MAIPILGSRSHQASKGTLLPVQMHTRGNHPKGETMSMLVREFPTELNWRLRELLRVQRSVKDGMTRDEAVIEAVEEWVAGRS